MRPAWPSVWFRSDWINPFRPEDYNWIDFTFAQATLEFDRRFGNFEFHFALAGFHFGGVINVSGGDEKFKADLDEMVKGFGSGTARVSITLSRLEELEALAEVAKAKNETEVQS